MRHTQGSRSARRVRGWLAASALAITTVLGSAQARAEWAVDAHFGLPFPAGGETELDGDASASFPADGDVDEDVSFGLRVGYFFPVADFLHLGVSLESAAILGELGGLDYNIVPTTAALTLRFPILKDQTFKYGRIQPYLGIGPSAVWSEVQQQVYSDSTVNIGADTRIGINYMFFENFGVFAEYRFLYFKSDFEDYTERGTRGNIDVTSYTHIPTLGVAWRFDTLVVD